MASKRILEQLPHDFKLVASRNHFPCTCSGEKGSSTRQLVSEERDKG